jgi:hypothetical protein
VPFMNSTTRCEVTISLISSWMLIAGVLVWFPCRPE